MPTRASSVVVLDVHQNRQHKALSEDEAMLQLFAFTDPLSLKSGAEVFYGSGNYDELVVDHEGSLERMWVGELVCLRRAGGVLFERDPHRGMKIIRTASSGTLTPEQSTFFAYLPARHIVLLVERAAFPYSRVQTYVRRAQRKFNDTARGTGAEIALSLVPRERRMGIFDSLRMFDKVFSISTRLGHSRSPGDRYFDRIIETINADHIAELIVSPNGSPLNVAPLMDPSSDLPQFHSLNHLDRNPENGSAVIKGEVGGDPLEINTKKPIERVRVTPDGDDGMAFARAFAGILRGLKD